MKWYTHLLHLQLHTLSREPVAGHKEGFLKSKHEMHTEWDVDIGPAGLNAKGPVCLCTSCLFPETSHSFWRVSSSIDFKCWASRFFCPRWQYWPWLVMKCDKASSCPLAPPRFIKKLEHSWKALVYDGVSGSALGRLAALWFGHFVFAFMQLTSLLSVLRTRSLSTVPASTPAASSSSWARGSSGKTSVSP